MSERNITLRASMRPRHEASEIEIFSLGSALLVAASMRPRHEASEITHGTVADVTMTQLQ